MRFIVELIALGIFCIVFLIIFWRRISRSIKRWMRNHALRVLKKRIMRFKKISLVEVMTKDVITIGPRRPIQECMQLFAGHNIGCVVVTEQGSVVGLVTERDLLRACASGRLSVAVKEVMSHVVVTLSTKNKLGDAISYSVRNNVRKIPLVHDGILRGIITQTDLQYLFDHFFRINEFASVPLASSLISDRYVLVDGSMLLPQALTLFLERNADSLFITKEGMVLGMLTERDILNEYLANPLAEKTPVKALMKIRLMTAEEDQRIDEVNRIMIENNVRRLPVFNGTELTGIITQRRLIETAYHYLSRLEEESYMISME